MFYGDKPEETRQVFFDVWHNYQKKELLDEKQNRILQVLLQHPEYHYVFSNEDKYLARDFHPEMDEVNPFFHFGLHLAILDQIKLNQPVGITKLYQNAYEVFQSEHEATHCLMNALAMELFEMQKNSKAFNEKAYLKTIKKALKKGYW